MFLSLRSAVPQCLLGCALAGFLSTVTSLVAEDSPKTEDKAKTGQTESQEASSGSEQRKTEATPSDEKKDDSRHDQDAKLEAAIREEAEEYCRAFREHDASSAAKHFTDNAEFVAVNGETFTGRNAIEGALKQCFEDGGDCRLELTIDSLQFPSSAVAIEDGTSWTIHGGTETPVSYTAVHVKDGGTWRIASVRERAISSTRPQRDKLDELNWLLGDWIDESGDSTVLFQCRPMVGGNFLDRDFTVQMGDEPAMTGTQRIGWDPIARTFRVWYFDSEGGFGDGTWTRHGANWVLKLSGVTADGELAAGTFLYRVVNPHTVTWRALEHVIGDEQFDDGDEITMVRQSPAPRAAMEKKASSNDEHKDHDHDHEQDKTEKSDKR